MMQKFARGYALAYIVCFICQVRGDVVTEMLVIDDDYDGEGIVDELLIELEPEGMIADI